MHATTTILNNRIVQRGYTIVELVVVIAVIAILSTIVFVSYNGVQANGRDAERVSDMLSVKSQLEVYFNDNGTYPTATQMTNSVASTIAGGSGMLKGLSADSLVNPSDTSGHANSFAAIAGSGTPANNVYWYQAYQSNGSSVCAATPCAKFKIMYTKESGATVTLSSIN